MLIFALGIFNQVSHGSRHWPEFGDRVHLSQMAELNEWLANYAREYHWKRPAISLDIISGYLNCGTITAAGFEKTGHFVEFYSLLGSSIFAQSREEALRLFGEKRFRHPDFTPSGRKLSFYRGDCSVLVGTEGMGRQAFGDNKNATS